MLNLVDFSSAQKVSAKVFVTAWLIIFRLLISHSIVSACLCFKISSSHYDRSNFFDIIDFFVAYLCCVACGVKLSFTSV